MPQLDFMTFMPQYFWLVVFFLFFYNLITNYMLPRLFTMMKVRKEKIASLQSDASADAVNDYDTIMRSTTSRARVAITEAAQSSIKQVAAKAAFINENAWADSNQKYLQALGNLQAKSYVISSLLAQGSGKKR
jgi:hypothetical protein